MRITIRETSNISQVESIWRELYAVNNQLSPFDSFDFCRAIYNDIVYRIKARVIPKIFIVDIEGKKLILPLVFNRNNSNYQFLSFCNGGGYCGAVYDPHLSTEALSKGLLALRDKLNSTIILGDIPADGYDLQSKNPLFECLENMTAVSDRKERMNVVIDMSRFGEYPEYIASLTKNARQNLRTAYNRLNKDNRKLEFHVEAPISDKEFDRIMALYERRHELRYGIKTNLLKSFYLKYLNYSSRSLRKNPEAMHALLYIDGELAGFLSGYLHGLRWIVPRLSINADFKFYSPGILLIDQVAHYMFDRGIKVLDLSKGDEPYKLQMGGRVIYSYSFTL